MTNYVKSVDFASKDALATGIPAKAGKGAEVDTEFNNIATAITTKEDTANKNVAGGYAGLDGTGKLAVGVLPATGVQANVTNTFTAFQGISAPQDEQLRLGKAAAATNPFISFYDNDTVTRNGYMQMQDNGAVFQMVNERSGGIVQLATTGGGAVLINGVNAQTTALITSGVFSTTRLGNGTPTVGNYLRGDGFWTQPTFAQLGGSVNDAQMVSTNVTQYQGLFSLAASQITSGTFADARIAQSNVTQHMAASYARNITGKAGVTKTLSTSAASGGADGDIWYQY